jgi:hypothetical protein
MAELGRRPGPNATVDAVFSQPQTIGVRTVIPVARVAYVPPPLAGPSPPHAGVMTSSDPGVLPAGPHLQA